MDGSCTHPQNAFQAARNHWHTISAFKERKKKQQVTVFFFYAFISQKAPQKWDAILRGKNSCSAVSRKTTEESGMDKTPCTQHKQMRNFVLIIATFSYE